jgi:DNA polymerase I
MEVAVLTVLLLDGYNLLYRAFTSLPSAIVASDGRPINAVYGVITFLLRTMRDLNTDRMAFTLDTPDTPTFRHLRFPAYQAQRGPLGGVDSDDFARQADLAKSLLPHLGIPVLSLPGFEADDIMGSLAVALASTGDSAIIVSTDRDLLQLVRPGVEVLAPGNPPIRAATDADVMARLGVPPSGVTTFKALAGDASDNIPGVRGIGVKTAARLVGQFETLEHIYSNLDELPRAVATKLDVDRDAAFLFREIVTVVTDLHVPTEDVRAARVHFGPNDRARGLLEQAERAREH